jgi:integrase
MKLKPGEGLVTVKDTRLGVTVREPEIYSEDELEKFFKACSFEESLLFRTYLLTGFREDEVRFLAWGDLDFEAGTLRVTPKPQYDFAIKDHEERRVPVPFWHVNQFERKVDFKRSLRPDWKPQDSELVFPTASGRPDGHHLEKCKRIARRAGLDESKFWLHKFRSHYATHLLRSGFDIISVRKLLGHKPGSQATFRYLAPMPFDEMREKGFHELFEAFDDYKLRERDADCTNEQDATLIAPQSMPEGVVPDIMEKLKEELQKAETKRRQKPERTV